MIKDPSLSVEDPLMEPLANQHHLGATQDYKSQAPPQTQLSKNLHYNMIPEGSQAH